MDNLEQQMDEVEALGAIYADDWQIEDKENRSYSIKILDGNDSVKLYIKLPADYPSNSPPKYEISAPHLDLARKISLGNLLDEVYSSLIGETVIYQWIEGVREELQRCTSPEQTNNNENNDFDTSTNKTEETCLPSSNNVENCPVIHHGEVIVDRKSSFQGHAAAVFTVDQVEQVLRSLHNCKKIEHAKHNIYAYRIFHEEKNIFIHDCDDDGESQAGGRLLHLLEIVDAKNVVVIVSRWYGGIHLGPDRFRHINNAARHVLQTAEFIKKKS